MSASSSLDWDSSSSSGRETSPYLRSSNNNNRLWIKFTFLFCVGFAFKSTLDQFVSSSTRGAIRATTTTAKTSIAAPLPRDVVVLDNLQRRNSGRHRQLLMADQEVVMEAEAENETSMIQQQAQEETARKKRAAAAESEAAAAAAVISMAHSNLNASLQSLSASLTAAALEAAVKTLQQQLQKEQEYAQRKNNDLDASLARMVDKAQDQVKSMESAKTALEESMKRLQQQQEDSLKKLLQQQQEESTKRHLQQKQATEQQKQERPEQTKPAAAAKPFYTPKVDNPKFHTRFDVGPHIPLKDLVKPDPTACDAAKQNGHSNVTVVHDTILPESITHPPGRKIPKIVHITSKTRCLSNTLYQNLLTWKFPNHSLYYHDDVAVERLLTKYWPEFPQLQLIRRCMISGAAMADLWRYLVLWEYGGIYTDIDGCPGPNFSNATAIADEDDAWIIPEQGGFVSQYFIAASPRHPWMHMAVMATLERLLSVQQVGSQYVPYITGPGALKHAFVQFNKKLGAEDEGNYARPGPGLYVAPEFGNRSITVVGTRRSGKHWIVRYCMDAKAKQEGYSVLGQTHFHKAGKKQFTDSCAAHLYKVAMKQKYELDERLKEELAQSGVNLQEQEQ